MTATTAMTEPKTHQIVIVGGGAAGLELATQLGNRYGREGRAQVTLIERERTHFWKPHLHEIAAGSMSLSTYETNYLAQAYWHGFRYRIGQMTGIDRVRKEVIVAPHIDDDGEQVTAERRFPYDTLVVCIGSLTHDFGTPGVAGYAIALENPRQAARFHRRVVNACIRAHAQPGPLWSHQLQVAIIGAGATGVELAAELHNSTRGLVSFGLDRIDPKKDIRITLIEANARILPALPERLSAGAMALLQKQGVVVRCESRVAKVLPRGVELASGETIAAELVVWAAGVKAPDVLKDIAGLETNRINQLVVTPTLQTTLDEDIFAIGDCAACQWSGQAPGVLVPPRAQAAHQQAAYLAREIPRRIAGKPLTPWQYRDFGSLVSLGKYSTVGNLMGALVGRNLWVEGLFARGMYLSLFKMHELALHGFWKVALDTLARLITRRTEPHVKLH